MTTPTAAPVTTPVHQAPALQGDNEREISITERIERRIAWNLIEQLGAAGFAVVKVYDGGETVKCTDALAAMEAIFAVGIAFLFVKKPRHGERWIKLVLGNGEDMLSDWGYSEADRDGFNAFIQAFKPEDNW